VANLIFDQAERKPLTDEVRNRIAARGAVLKLESLTPYFGSLERDPVHPSAYYLAVDGAQGEPLLLYLALATAPTSSIFHKPLLIGRTRRVNGPEMVINAIPFAASDQANIAKFAGQINTAFLPRPQGSRTAIATASPTAFRDFRAIQKRTGKNLAALALAPDSFSAGVWAAIRAGWRDGYAAFVDIAVGAESLESARETIRQSAGFSGFSVDASALFGAPPFERALHAVAQLHETIRQSKSALKTGRSFDLELSFGEGDTATTPAELTFCLDWLKARSHAAQAVAPRVGPDADIEGLAGVARHYQASLTLNMRDAYGSDLLDRVVRATAGRVICKISGELGTRPGYIDCLAEHLVG
jgi:hypothetical protein